MTKRLLFITSTRIGDAVLSTGLLGHLIEKHPGIRVTVAAGAPAAPLFKGVPGLERVIVMEKRRRAGHWWDLWRDVVGTRWDMAVDLRRSALTWFLRTGERLVLPKDDRPVHRVRQIASLVGLDTDPPPPRLWALPEHEATAEHLIPAGTPVLAVGPTANWPAKTWQADNFAALIGSLTGPAGILPGARVAFFGGPGERPQAAAAIEAVPEDRRIDLVGRIDVLTAYACLRRCSLYVGNDSALMHIAAAAGTPTLGLFGPTREELYGPWGSRAGVVRTAVPYAKIFPPKFDHVTSPSLMDSLSVDAASEGAETLWRRVHG